MKFAKKLQDESYAEWHDEYIDYKMMKKVLKQEHDEAISSFVSVLEEQLHKVHSFMRGRQQAISEEVAPLELEFGTGAASSTSSDIVVRQTVDGHCSKFVEDIERFRDFAFLNQEAIRKIIKKFDKRFQMDFSRTVGLPSTTALLVNDRDICTWLLDPAQHVLRLIQGMLQAQRGPIERPLRQYGFWMNELQAGIELARLTFDGEKVPDPTVLRLNLLGESGLRIRNTFIDCGEAEAEVEVLPQRRRSVSHPPRMKRPAAGAAAEESSEAPSPSHGAQGPASYASTDDGGEYHGGAERAQTAESSPSDAGSRQSPPTSAAGAFDNLFDEIAFARMFSKRGLLDDAEEEPHARQDSGGRSPASASRARQRRGRSEAQPDFGGRGQRWWSQLRDVCPVSGFPVGLLPYPPFKLHVRPAGTAKPISRFVDGPFLVLSMLVSWKFEALGCPLTVSDITALDTYMKRCKLGPFRIGYALELVGFNTEESLQELQALRARASRRLDVLRHVQRVRVERSEPEVQQQEDPPQWPPAESAHDLRPQHVPQRPPPQEGMTLWQQWLQLGQQLCQQHAYQPPMEPQFVPPAPGGLLQQQQQQQQHAAHDMWSAPPQPGRRQAKPRRGRQRHAVGGVRGGEGWSGRTTVQ
mmetsp:Transcript_201/g.484  ORF Transcript_201/g.484 Transcript_201/m.484 type:complete len:639 (-) Transcript_201:260-2176(-)